MIRAALTIGGAAHLWFGWRALHQARSRVELEYGACIAACGVAGLLWPAPNAILFDQVVHIAGAALLLRYACLTLGFVFGFASLSALMAPLSRWHRAALGVYAALLAALACAWILARGASLRDAEILFYSGYHGTTLALLALNLITSLTIVYACALLMLEISRVPHEAQDRQARVAMWIIFAILGGIGVTGGLMIAGQALADRMGHGATAVAVPLDVMVASAIVTSPILNTWAFYLLPAWRHVRLLVSLRQEIRVLQRLQQDMVVLLMLLTDRLVHLVDHVDPTAVQTVAARGQERRLDPYQSGVVVEAARWITFRRVLLGRGAWSNLDAATRKAVDESIVIDAARRCRSGPGLYKDVYVVVILALGPHYVPAWLEVEWNAQGWHCALAELVADVSGGQKGSRAGLGDTSRTARQPHPKGWARETWRHTRRLQEMAAAKWSPARHWLSLRGARAELDASGDDLTALRALCDDLLIYLHDKTDTNLIRTVATLCAEQRIPSYWARVACEAARWVGFFWPGAMRGPAPWEEAVASLADDQSVAVGDAAQRAMQRMDLLADTSRIVLLVLRPEQVPPGIAPFPAPTEWHCRIAGLIQTALADDPLVARQAPASV